VLLSVVLGACAAGPVRLGEPARARSERYAALADELARADRGAEALHLATRALVVRLADCAYECPEVARSFVQLGDLRLTRGQPDHAAQSYARALQVLRGHERTHHEWVEATRVRLDVACQRARRAPPGCASPTAAP
jgi:cytochrome c-type biogenesis protein CcmH/NrfG